MIFLGAGASKPFRIPTLEELSKEVMTKLEELGQEDLLERIKNSCEEFNIELDFETLYSILEGMINPEISVRHAGPLAAFIVGKKSHLPKSYDYAAILDDLRKTIYEKCTIDNQCFAEVERCYDSLFEVTNKNISEEGLIGYAMGAMKINRVFVTTNYDMSLELYFLSKGFEILDGFKDTGGLVKSYNPSSLENPLSKERTVLKLHGSIFQFAKGDEIVKTKLDPHSPTLPFKINVEREMMIYPTKGKDILVQPYFTFFSTFKRIRWSKLLVIGYSFRDEPVNTAILENMRDQNNSQLIVINPKADDVIENLYDNVSESFSWKIPKNRLFKFSGKFGTSEVFEYLRRIESVSDNQDPDFDPAKFE